MTLSSHTPEIRDYFLQQKFTEHPHTPPPPKKERKRKRGGKEFFFFFSSSLLKEVVGWLNAEAVSLHNFLLLLNVTGRVSVTLSCISSTARVEMPAGALVLDLQDKNLQTG